MSLFGLAYEESERYLRSDAYCAPIALAIEHALGESGHGLTVFNPHEGFPHEAEAVIFLAPKTPEIVAVMREHRSVLCVNPDFPGCGAPVIAQDDDAMGRLAARALREAGRTRLVVLCATEENGYVPEPYRLRVTAFREEIAALSTAAAPIAVDVLNASFTHVPGTSGVTASRPLGEQFAIVLLARHPRPDGIFAVNDCIADEVVEWFAERSVKVPQEVAFVGCDNMPTLGPLALTTVHVPKLELGERAAAAAVALLADGRIANGLIAPRLARRETTPITGTKQ
jgi:LacI family transcriptional regulator